MGQNMSTDGVQEAVDGVVAGLDSAQKASEHRIKLYKFVHAGNGGQWELSASNARPRFYDSKEDTNATSPEWFLEVEGSDIDSRVDQELGYVVNMGECRVTFSAAGDCYALRFPNVDLFRSFSEEMRDKLFENTYGKANTFANRKKELGDDYAAVFFADNSEARAAEPMDTENEEYRTPEKMSRDEEAMAQKDDDEDGDYEGLLMGAGENNYLMRGGGYFNVLRNVDGGVEDKGLSFTLTPMKGAPSTPQPRAGGGRTPGPQTPRILLANCEQKMNMLTPENPNVLHHADIETQKIVSTWKFQKDTVDIPISDIAHDDKGGQLDDRSTFLGLDANRLCKWDLRDPHGVVNSTPVVQYDSKCSKDYCRGTNFMCMATSGNGFVAVGSKDGKIRLYNNKTLTMAKTAIPGLGAPITSIDVTYDGKWVLATTDKYLMVVKTTYDDDKGKASSGFTSRMGGRGSVPRLLRLKLEDAQRTGGKPFAKGKFTWITESGSSERWVVANCGKFSVIWNFSKLKTCGSDTLSFGGLPTSMDYIMSSKEEDVVDAAFLHSKYAKNSGQEQVALVVATPHHLFNMG